MQIFRMWPKYGGFMLQNTGSNYGGFRLQNTGSKYGGFRLQEPSYSGAENIFNTVRN